MKRIIWLRIPHLFITVMIMGFALAGALLSWDLILKPVLVVGTGSEPGGLQRLLLDLLEFAQIGF